MEEVCAYSCSLLEPVLDVELVELYYRFRPMVYNVYQTSN